MQIPKQVLAAQMPSGAKAVLVAMWQAADNEPPWVPTRQAELAKAVSLTTRMVRRWLRFLREMEAIREESRELLGRRFDGYGLARIVTPPPSLRQRNRSSSATERGALSSVAKREKPHEHATDRLEADLKQIAKHARRSDSHIQICERLLKANAPCSEGVWHKVKVFRRIRRMVVELGDEGRKSQGAGEIVERWKKTR